MALPPPSPPDDSYTGRVSRFGLRNAPAVEANRPMVHQLDPLVAEVIFDRRVPFTVERAAEYINLPVFPGERDVIDAHVQKLVDEMSRGRFNWKIVTIARCQLGATTFKINGQHTSWGRMALPSGDSPEVREVAYRVGSAEQLKALYATFDRAKPRTDAHLTRLELLGADAVDGLWAPTVGQLAAALRFWRFEKGEDYKRCGPAELAAIVNEQHASLFNLVGRFFQSLDVTSMPRVKRQPVMAAMLDGFHKVPTIAPAFWKDVAEATNLVKDDARWHLNHYLNNTAIQRSGANTVKKIVASEEMYRVCVAAWNRWRAGEKVALLKPTARRQKSL